ncbi:hypothetical protein [Streptomyces alboniger]|uniref:Uncharacterized protein n=1 Tax=Streptomyces alboniger TaxID=132473 RepID=A0A5J6HJY0_STRAD|nr:hypothetical protein [Streptomyces alboniger]QEV18753.1 hypothetical protein CP975_15760 [Streptomyces alboniger]
MSALAATTLLTSAATADDTGPAGDTVDITDDAGTVSLDEEGLFELPASNDGEIQPQNFTSKIVEWKPGNHESSHWSDNDYTEIKFTGCSLEGVSGGGRSLHVQLHQAIPFSLDRSLGSKRFTNCFKGSGKTSRGEWDTHESGGDNRYFTIPKHNDSEYSRTSLDVRKVYVDTSKAD